MSGGSPPAPLLLPLARWAAGLDGRALPEGTNAALADTALDWAGAAIAGTAHPLHAPYVAAMAACGGPAPAGRGGACAVLGDARSWPAAEAAAANAAISHLWEFDDAHRAATMHPGITVWPAVLALAQARPGVADVRAAVVVGYEVGLRVGALFGKGHYAVCHTTATAGALGAAAACARLPRLDADGVLSALGHAGTQAAGLWQFLDDGATDAKAFHAGVAVRDGLAAASLAEAGIAGAPRILEGPRGMLAAWKLAATPGAGLEPGGAEVPHEITRVTIKGWPVCGQMHSLLDATEDLRRRHRPDPDALAGVRVEAPSARLAIADRKRPRTVSEMKFSPAFCVALLLRGGDLPFAGLDPRALADGAVHALAERIEVAVDPAFDARFPRERPARITVRTADGARLVEERSFRRGDPELPWSWEPLVARFGDIAGLAGVGVDARRAVVAWCAGFGRGEAVSPAAEAVFRAVPDARGAAA